MNKNIEFRDSNFVNIDITEFLESIDIEVTKEDIEGILRIEERKIKNP